MQRLFATLLVLGLVVFAAGCKRGNKSTGGDRDNTGIKGVPGLGDFFASTPISDGKGTFTVGKATTYITGPFDASGHIDYAAALNERMSKGVTAQNNANVLIWKALGPRPLNVTMPDGFFEKLGMQSPPAGGEHFITLRKYMDEHVRGGPGSADAAIDTMARLGTHPWKADDQINLRNWLDANEKPLANVVEATKRTHYYSPMIPTKTERGSGGIISVLLPGVQQCRELAQAIACRAMLFAGHGYADSAWKDLLACHRLGRHVGHGATLIEGLTGIAIEQIACRADIAFLAQCQPDAKQLEGYIRDLRALPTPVEAYEYVDVGERFMFLDHIMQLDHQGFAYLARQGDGGAAPMQANDVLLNGIDWNPALENANKLFDRMVAAMREKDRSAKQRQLERIKEDLLTLKSQLKNAKDLPPVERGRAVGDALLVLMTPAASKVQEAGDRRWQSVDNTIVAFALAGYQRNNGRYPSSLNDLAPKYLAQVPRDIFSGNALLYKPAANGYLLYSVGANGVDDGGRGYDDNSGGDDIVVRMPPN
jgi:hypothetical protein